MIKDKVIVGAIVGLLADAVKLAVNYLAFTLGFTRVVFWQIAATLFLDRQDLFKPVAYIVGAVADLTVTAIIGVVFIYFIHFTGHKYLWIKGVGFGLAVWVGLFGTFLGTAVRGKLPQEPSGILVTLVAHSIFGLSLAFFTWLLQKTKLIKPKLKS